MRPKTELCGRFFLVLLEAAISIVIGFPFFFFFFKKRSAPSFSNLIANYFAGKGL